MATGMDTETRRPHHRREAPVEEQDDASELDLFDVVRIFGAHWKPIVGGALTAGTLAFGVASLIPPSFTARTTLLPPQQQQSSAAAALASLGALGGLAGLAGSMGSLKSPADQYVAFLESATVADRIIDQYKLLEVYDEDYRQDARKELSKNVRVTVGKKDGLITVEVDDHDPKRAAEMAKSYVEGLRQLTSTLAVSEAQQRRVFFEEQLKQTRDKLTQAQVALQSSGFSQGALKAEPRAAAEGYARLRAEATAAEVRLQGMRRMLTDETPELLQQQAVLSALRDQLARLEQRDIGRGDSDYVGKYREFRYQETLFELFARQYELARVDESREGALIQVVDMAQPPERKSKPKRGLIALISVLVTALAIGGFVVARRIHLTRALAYDGPLRGG